VQFSPYEAALHSPQKLNLPSGVRGSNSLDEVEMRDAGIEPCPEDKGEKEGPMKGF
jgi:hypothetical protein